MAQSIDPNTLDYNERDPKQIHDPSHFQVAWEEVFAEPDPGVHSLKPIWKASYIVFSWVRLWTYRIMSILGVIQACCYGMQYGCTACYMIWCCTPCLKLCTLQLIPIRTCYVICIDTCIAPIINALSMLLWNIRVTMAKDDGSKTQHV